MIKWVMVVIYLTPGGDPLMKSYHEYKTETECVQELDRARRYPHPMGLRVQLSCEQMAIEKVYQK